MDTSNSPAKSRNTLEALQRLEKIILDTLDFRQVVQKICDSVLNELYFLDLSYRIVILTLINDQENSLQVVAISKTPEAQKAMQATQVPFEKIQIPISESNNLAVKISRTQQIETASDWSQIFSPPLSSDNATATQQAAGVQASVVAPIVAKGKALGVLVVGVAKTSEMITEDEQELIQGFTDIVAIAVENSKLYSKLEIASAELATANDKLKDLDRLKDEFVSVAAHALRSPMTAIKGYLSMVLEGDSGVITDRTKQFLQGAFDGNNRLIRLVNHMLDISRIESGRLIFNISEVQLEELVQSEVSDLTILAKQKNLSLTYKKPETPLPKVSIDPERIREVINNLIGNAIKFTQSGDVSINHEIKNNFLLTHVTDTGPGIDQEDLVNLFRKFSQARNRASKNSGSGLGLYVSKIIMQEFGGDVSVVSQVGKGSTFTFSIPIKKR